MQNHNNITAFTDLTPFYYIHNQLPLYTFIPITPSLTQNSPHPDHSPNYNNFIFQPHLDHQFYYARQSLHYQVPSNLYQAQYKKIAGMIPCVLNRNQIEVQTCSSLTAIQRLDRNEKTQPHRSESCQVMIDRKLNQGRRFRSMNEGQGKDCMSEGRGQDCMSEGRGQDSMSEGRGQDSMNEGQGQDREYVPECQRRKKVGMKYQENQNRNILPNQIKQILSFMQKPSKSGALLERVLHKYPHAAEYSAKRYYQYQTLLKNKLGHYTNQKSLKLVTQLYEPKCESWTEQEQRYYNQISRVLIRHFLYQDSVFIILTSKRMKREKKSDHLRARRQIARMVLDVLRG